MRCSLRIMTVAAALVSLAGAAIPVAADRLPGADHGGAPLTATLTGVVSTQSGTATLTVNPGQQEVCYVITVSNLAPVFAAHIHVGGAGVNGPIVVPLFSFTPPTNQTTFSGCVRVPGTRAVLTAILQNPSGYYVNVHTTQFPAGAIRGQLSLGG